MIHAQATYDRYGNCTIDVNGRIIDVPKGMPTKAIKRYVNNWTPGIVEPVKVEFEAVNDIR